jgi:hypothetical protein
VLPESSAGARPEPKHAGAPQAPSRNRPTSSVTLPEVEDWRAEGLRFQWAPAELPFYSDVGSVRLWAARTASQAIVTSDQVPHNNRH